MADKLQFGMIGMAVMGRNLALNILDHGYSVAVYNLEPDLTRAAVEESGGRLVGTQSLADLVERLETPRKIMMMIKAGKPVDSVLEQLKPMLGQGDIVIDGGNFWYEDTGRREHGYTEAGLRFFGVGVSGGEDGARHGPSLMPGGDAEAYQAIRPIFEAIAAKTDSGACVTHVGPDGAGHFVKMVHNGIEYADMQFIAEAYHILKDLGGLDPQALGSVFAEWNRGPLESFLIEITSQIFAVKDPKGSGHLIDQVLDKAGQKGTGRWTAQVALEYGVPIPSIAAAIDARVMSSLKNEREAAERVLTGPAARTYDGDITALIDRTHDALYAAKIVAYVQGMDLIVELDRQNAWSIDLREIARNWKGGLHHSRALPRCDHEGLREGAGAAEPPSGRQSARRGRVPSDGVARGCRAGPAVGHSRIRHGDGFGLFRQLSDGKPATEPHAGSAGHVRRLGLIRSRGHFPKGGYDVPDGATNQESAPTPAV